MPEVVEELGDELGEELDELIRRRYAGESCDSNLGDGKKDVLRNTLAPNSIFSALIGKVAGIL